MQTRDAHITHTHRDRAARVRVVGHQVRTGAYDPPIEGVVESLVVALLPHIRLRG